MAQAQPKGPTAEQMRQMQQQFFSEAAKQGLTPEQFQERQRQQLAADAAKQGLTVEQYVNQLKQRALQEHQMRQQQKQQVGAQQQQKQEAGKGQPHQHSHQHARKVELNPTAPPKPEALAVAKFLRSQDLKTRSCILDGQRKEMFKVKRAIRALQTPAYKKASAKIKILPEVKDEATARNAFHLLPLSMLALRVSKADPHDGHNHAKPAKDPKRVKGQWTVKVEREQEFEPLMHYVWLYEGPQWKQKALAAGVLVLIMAVVMFPLWPIMLRQGVWYLTMGMMGLIGLFFLMSIVRLILFCATVLVVPPGLWLYPNLFEDVGFFDSFRPLWAWQETKKKKKSPKGGKDASTSKKSDRAAELGTVGTRVGTGEEKNTVSRRHQAPQVEAADDE